MPGENGSRQYVLNDVLGIAEGRILIKQATMIGRD
jgi:hypothetical protein